LYIDARDLTFTDEPDGSHRAGFDLMAVTYDSGGQVAERTNRTYTIAAPRENFERQREQGMLYEFAHPAGKPGAHEFRVALRDVRSQQVGSANQLIDVPDVKKGRLTLSSLLVREVSAPAANALDAGEPAANSSLDGSAAVRVFKPGAQIEFGYQILNARVDAQKHTTLETQIFLWRDDKRVFAGTPQRLDASDQPDPRRIGAGGSLQLDGKMVPGDYLLQVTVADRLAREKARSESQWIDFEIRR